MKCKEQIKDIIRKYSARLYEIQSMFSKNRKNEEFCQAVGLMFISFYVMYIKLSVGSDWLLQSRANSGY